MNAPQFTIKHIGINTSGAAEAEQLTARLCALFQLPRGHENETHIFAGSLFEVMKHGDIGEKGHIALQTADVEAAIDYFARKGVSIQAETIRRDGSGRITFVYLDLDLGGFAVHLTC